MVKIPFNPQDFGIVLFVTVTHGNVKRRLKMVLDTGATYCMIPWHVAEELGYTPALSKTLVEVNTANGQIHTPLITVESMTVLKRTVRRCQVMVHDLPETSRVDGLIGLSFLMNCDLHIDFVKGVLELK
jgi:clan AA aspartic protease (TIGR02281 family)